MPPNKTTKEPVSYGVQPTIPTPDDLKSMLLEQYNFAGDEAKDFLYPPYKLDDPFLFRDMEAAVTRIHKAIENKEHIGIYADYDCDGIPGAVVLLDLFKKIGVIERTHVYIPDRHDEGYGVSELGIEELVSQGVTLIITVDVGITAVAQVAHAQSRGIDVIVTDHHACLRRQEPPSEPELPNAFAIIHPEVSNYSNQDACGAAVAFHLVRGYLHRYGEVSDIKPGWEKWLLDLVGFATLADMVPLTGENRMLASYGLMVMKKTRRVGLIALFEKNYMNMNTLTESDLTFTVAPRLNAASRMDTPMLAFELLSTNDITRATAIVNKLDQINNERKVLVARIVKEAHASLEHRDLPALVVVGNPQWRPAVLGLVANKLQEKYARSFFVWGEGGDGGVKGSCRMQSIHHAAYIFQALPDGMMLHAGGHQAAGGFSILKEKVHFLEEALNAALASVDHKESEQVSHAAIMLPLGSVTTRHLQVVRSFAPFGVGNPEPIFLFENVEITSVKMFGKQKDHIECVVRDTTGIATAFIFFADDACIKKLVSGATVSFTGTLESGWRGGVRIRIKEIL